MLLLDEWPLLFVLFGWIHSKTTNKEPPAAIFVKIQLAWLAC